MKNKIYLAKPYDRTENFSRDEARFIHTMNISTPEVKYISIHNNLNNAYERIPEGLPQYLNYNGVDMEYIYPCKDAIINLDGVDLSIPILQPFKYTQFQESLLLFDKVIFTDDIVAEHFIRKNNLEDFEYKFYILQKHSEGLKPFMEYSLSDEKKPVPHNIKYYDVANKLINAFLKEDFSSLEYKSL